MTKQKITRILFFLQLFIICHFSSVSGGVNLNVKQFGAYGDGVKDDTKAFIECINQAQKKRVNVIVPQGNYKITSSIGILARDNVAITIIGILDEKGKRPLIFSSQFINIIHILGDPFNPQGKVIILNLELRGNNPPYSGAHPYFDKPNFYRFGIGIFNKKEVLIKNCVIKNIYGEGVFIINEQGQNNSAKNRFESVEIVGNSILDTWGLRPSSSSGSFDEYGDGIYVSNCAKGLVKNNKIINDLLSTRQFGRAGIVLEYNIENFTIDSNAISGYDRNIHIEEDLGNIVIKNNKITGSDFGILVFESCKKSGHPIYIYNNYISNEGIPFIAGLKTVRWENERALLSIETRGFCRSLSKVGNNTFFVTLLSDRVNMTIIRNLEKDVAYNGNKYLTDIVKNDAQPRIIHSQRVRSISNETYQNTRIIFETRGSKEADFILSHPYNIKLINSSSNIKF